MFKKYLLSSACYRPDDEQGSGTDEPLDLGDLQDAGNEPEPEGDEAKGPEPEGDQDGDDGADNDGADDGQQRQQSRGQRQYAALREERRRLAEENAALTRQISEIRRAPPVQQQQPTESAQQRADRLALMSPEDRMREEVNETLARHQQRTDQVAAHLLDQSDRNSYENLALQNPLARKLAADVERELAGIRARGQDLPRQVVFIHLLGQRAFAQLQKAKPGREQRREQQKAPPTNGRGDLPGRRERKETTLQSMERRLDNVQI